MNYRTLVLIALAMGIILLLALPVCSARECNVAGSGPDATGALLSSDGTGKAALSINAIDAAAMNVVMQLPPRTPGIAGKVQPTMRPGGSFPVVTGPQVPTLKPEFGRPLPGDFGPIGPTVRQPINPPVGPVDFGPAGQTGMQPVSQPAGLGNVQVQQLPIGSR
jgi:hypothetical protein